MAVTIYLAKFLKEKNNVAGFRKSKLRRRFSILKVLTIFFAEDASRKNLVASWLSSLGHGRWIMVKLAASGSHTH